jgi:hypothetical protein
MITGGRKKIHHFIFGSQQELNGCMYVVVLRRL